MNHRTVRHFLIEECAVFIVAALPDHSGKSGAVFSCRFPVTVPGLQYVHIEKPLHKILIGTVAAYIPGFTVPDFKNSDRYRFKNIMEGSFIFAGDDSQVKQVYTAYGFIVIQFLRILIRGHRLLFVQLQGRLKWYRFAVVISLQL